MISDERLQTILLNKDVDNAEWGEAWSIIDGCLVIYDCEDETNRPGWLPKDEDRDEDGNTAEFVERMSA